MGEILIVKCKNFGIRIEDIIKLVIDIGDNYFKQEQKHQFCDNAYMYLYWFLILFCNESNKN